METKSNANDLYNEWRTHIDELAGMDRTDIVKCATIRTKALDLGHKYSLKTGKNIALHVVGQNGIKIKG